LSIIVIGLGNPILGDDGVGWRVAEQVRSSLAVVGQVGKTSCDPPPVDVDCLSLGGLSLMERLVGYQRALIIDAITTGASPPGTVTSFPLEDLPPRSGSHTASAHDTSLQTALQVGRAMGACLPEQVHIVAIAAQAVYEFSEELTAAVANAVPIAAQAALNVLSGWANQDALSGVKKLNDLI